MDVADLTDEQMAVMALTENESRKQLSQIEVVRAHKRAIDETSLSIQALADKLGMNRPTLSNNLRVLELPDFILQHVESGDLGITVARDFLVLQNADHAHTEDMQGIVDGIVNPPYYARKGLPDWRRSNVRRAISERVAYNETDYRPLGPQPDTGRRAEPAKPPSMLTPLLRNGPTRCIPFPVATAPTKSTRVPGFGPAP